MISLKSYTFNRCFQVIDLETLTESTIDRANVYSRKEIESALKEKAVILVFAHSHQEGDTTPSDHASPDTGSTEDGNGGRARKKENQCEPSARAMNYGHLWRTE